MVRHANILTVLGAACLAFLLTSRTANAADPNGTWTWTITTQSGREIDFLLELKQEGENLTGLLRRPGRDGLKIKDGTFKNDVVAFAIEFERGGNLLTRKFKGKVDGDTIKGTVERERDGEVRTRDWEAKREKSN